MVTDPEKIINNILSKFKNKGKLVKQFKKSTPKRKHRKIFSKEDINYIEYYTRENAEILGV
jgi:hypothetical protein